MPSQTLLPVALDRRAEHPLYRQLYEQLRELILGGRMRGGARLPSTRSLAEELGVSRNTVTSAFEQLTAEGYLTGRIGAGSYISDVLPDEALATRATVNDPARGKPRQRGLSTRGETLAKLRHGRNRSLLALPAFTPGLPDLPSFPFDIWTRLLARTWRTPDVTLLAKGDPSGYRPLREAITGYLHTARGVACTADQVLIVSGAQQGISLAAHVLLDAGDTALMENPGYPGVRGALLGAGIELVPVPVDDEGIDIDKIQKLAPRSRLACVAPSHQYPLGVTMTLARRLALLEWAAQCDGWIIEDDYDSEYRYSGRPLTALHGLDHDKRVIYVGSFSKVMFSTLRLGYLVVPEDLTDAFVDARAALDDHPPIIAQPALAAFIEQGYFASHIRRMRRLYAVRQEAFMTAASRHLDGLLEVTPSDAGMSLVARFTNRLRKRMSDEQAVKLLAEKQISATALSRLYANGKGEPGLLLGYAAVPEPQIDEGLKRVAEILRG